MGVMLRLRWLRQMCAAAVMACAATLHAQQPAQGAPSAGVDTLRVSTQLMQIPVLVLGPKRQAFQADPAKFRVQFDKGPAEVPRAVRVEGDDPITLSILVDGTNAKNSLLAGSEDALLAMLAEWLQPQDRVAVYSMDGCSLNRGATYTSARERDARSAVLTVVRAIPPAPRAKVRCERPFRLWDSMMMVLSATENEPGRHVLLAMTNGDDRGSSADQGSVSELATKRAVAVFAIAERGMVAKEEVVEESYMPVTSLPSAGASRQSRSMIPQATYVPVGKVSSSKPLVIVTEGSGGMVLETDAKDLQATAQHFVELVRGRYIVEFDPPKKLVGRQHRIDVMVGDPSAFVRSSGTQYLRDDPALVDPRVEHGKAAAAPAVSR